MIALLLATQIVAAALPQGVALEAVPPPRGLIEPATGFIRGPLRKDACPGAGRLEASFARPTALYRSGDRPPKTLRRWVDYPDGRNCLVSEAAP